MRKSKSKYQVGGLWATNKGAFADSVMSANAKLNFVNRYLHPKDYPVINNPDGSYSTHLMESSDNFAYPTIIQDKTGKLQKLASKVAYDYAMKNKQYIQFPTEEQAIWFADNGYKQAKQYQAGGDLKSILGYSKGSPYANNPYIDIFTPEGLIDMSNTPKDLMGIDNKGNVKKMKAGVKNPYKFEGDVVREIPLQRGGNPYKMSSQQILSYLYDNSESNMDEPQQEVAPEEKPKPVEQDNSEALQKARDEEEYNIAMQIAMAYEGNPYTNSGVPIHQSDHPFRAANEDLYSASKSLEGMSYGFGQEGQNGKIDCSGAVCRMLGIPRTTSEEIVSNANNFRQFTGDLSTIKEGTVIGVNSGNRPWEGQRKYGIDHVLLVVRNPSTGKLETKSSSGSKGFHTEPLEQSLKTYGKYNLYLGDYK